MALVLSKEKAEEWKELIRQQKSSGKGIYQWCKEKQILPRNFYYCILLPVKRSSLNMEK